MRRTRARLLACALVIATASVASASIVFGVDASARPSVQNANDDAGVDDDAGSDAPPEGGFDGPTDGGFDGPTEGGFDGPTDAGVDAPMEGGFDSGLDDSGSMTAFDGMMPPDGDTTLPDGGMTVPDGMVMPDAPPPVSISIQEPTIAISGQSGQPATGAATIYTMDSGMLGSAQLFSSDPSFVLTDCASTTCSYPGGQSVMPPYSLGIQCTPGASPTMATLFVSEASGGMGAMAIVTCTSTSSPPMLAVSPDSLMFGDQPVNTVSAAKQITITNTGGSTLGNIQINFGAGPNASQWQASTCTSTPCSLAPTASINVDVRFAPTSIGSKDVQLTVTSNGGTDTVSLQGRGTGGIMSVKTPMGPSYILDIGTIPLNQAVTRNIELENLGNVSYTATPSQPTPPYTIALGPHPVGPGATLPIAVTCQASTASANDNPQMVTITSDAYQGSPATVQLRCRIANTMLQIMPTMFDFGERRIGTVVPPFNITLTNPATAAAASIGGFDLQAHKPGLTLTTPPVPFTVAPGAMESATLALSTVAETDLTGEYVELTVDGEPLMFAVTGKVVTPHSRVVPVNQLDLGTACVGTDVSGNVMLINDGTATLAVDPPEMDQSFVAAAPGVPGPLAPTRSITAAVTPMSTAMGPIEGTLTWRDDVPSEHKIHVVLDYVASGTALSPRGLDFGSIAVDGDPAAPQHIKLQNCDLTATSIKIVSLKTKQGTLGAWRLTPAVGYTKMLAAKEQQAVTVEFEPPARGRYEAELTVQTASGRQVVKLVGDATGRDFDNTSFYACACNGPGAPSRGWPVLAAIVIVIFRRRRAPSSAR